MAENERYSMKVGDIEQQELTTGDRGARAAHGANMRRNVAASRSPEAACAVRAMSTVSIESITFVLDWLVVS